MDEQDQRKQMKKLRFVEHCHAAKTTQVKRYERASQRVSWTLVAASNARQQLLGEKPRIEQGKKGRDICMHLNWRFSGLVLRFLPLQAHCNENLLSHRSLNDTSTFYLDLFAAPFYLTPFLLMRVHLSLKSSSEGALSFAAGPVIPWSLSQRTFVPTTRRSSAVAVHRRSCGIALRMKGENSAMQFIQHFPSLPWQALHISCKWKCEKCENWIPQPWGESYDGVHVCCGLTKCEVFSSHLAFQQTGFRCVMHSHDVHCICVVSCAVNWEAWKPGRIIDFPLARQFLFGFIESAQRHCVKWHIIKFKDLMAYQMHRLGFKYSVSHLFRNCPSSAEIFLFYSFGNSSEQQLQQIHFPEDKNSWQARSSPQACRLACDTQLQLRAHSYLENELLIFNQDCFPDQKAEKDFVDVA